MSTSARIAAASSLGPTLSFEMYPPRTERFAATLDARLSMLTGLRPEFISITYGAAGSGPEKSQDMTLAVLRHPEVAAVAHLTCIGRPRAKVAEAVRELLAMGVRDILALRGDPQPDADGTLLEDELHTATDLVALIREIETDLRVTPGPDGVPLLERGERLSVSVAAYPAPESRPRELELEILAAKQAAGADYAITQVFHKAEDYLTLVDDARAQGITMPLLPGVLPYEDLGRLARLEELTGVRTPEKLKARLDLPTSKERRRAGADATLELATALLEGGAPGIHLYTFNQLSCIDEVAALVRSWKRRI